MIRGMSNKVPREIIPVDCWLIAIAVGIGLVIGGVNLAAGKGTDVATTFALVHSLQIAVGAWFGARAWLVLLRAEGHWLIALERRVHKIMETMERRGISPVAREEGHAGSPTLLIRLLSALVSLLPWFLSMVTGSAVIIVLNARVDIFTTNTHIYIFVAASVATCAAISPWLFSLLRLEWRIRRTEKRLRALDTAPSGFDNVTPDRGFLFEATNRATLLVLSVAGVKPLGYGRTAGTTT
jgi:hypothetical protein